MNKHVTIGVYDYDRQKLCDLYDNQTELIGQAYGIVYTKSLDDGINTLSFNIPYIIDEKVVINTDTASRYGVSIYGAAVFGASTSVKTSDKNFRWFFLKSEYLIRYTEDDFTEWFVATKPKKSKTNKAIYGSVNCNSTASLLKTKNIYMTFDDTNGIGKIDYIIDQILAGTGWSAICDRILEKDGVTEKIRSLKSDGKQGALQLIITTCNLFQCYASFDTDSKIVYIRAKRNRDQVLEIEVGKNLSALTWNHDSSDIATRIYVEGEYGDYGYIGIDDVNPTGLNYILNFDYYRSIGVFKASHEQAYATYIEDISAKKAEISANTAAIMQVENEINNLIGQCKVAVYYADSGFVTPVYTYGILTDAQKALNAGDKVVFLQNDGEYRYETLTVDPSAQIRSTDYGIAKFATGAAGLIGGKEVQIEAKEQTIEKLEGKIAVTIKTDRIAEYTAEIEQLEREITAIYEGTNDDPGLYEMMYSLMNTEGLFYQLDQLNEQAEILNGEQDDIEATFIAAMGYMLRDGYWGNTNYAPGQEEHLYADALDMSEQMAKPKTSYTFSFVRLLEKYDVPIEDYQLNAIVRVHDEELQVDDRLFIKKISYGVDDDSNGSIEISNEDITLTGSSLSTLVSRMAQLADLIDQKNTLYERAKAISGDGSIYTDRLNGQIDVLRVQLKSVVSNWYTDDQGNIIFTSADGSSAMQLCGSGFMIANGKNDDGSWNWRVFGTGNS